MVEYKAKEVTRAYRMGHNSTDIENSRKAYFNIDYRTKRKKSRVISKLSATIKFYLIEIGWSELETYALINPGIVYLNQEASKGFKMNVKEYSSRHMRLELIRAWGKRCMRHYYGKKRKRDAHDFAKRKRMVRLLIGNLDICYMSV